MWILHRKAGGAPDGAHKLVLMAKRVEEETLIKLKTWESRTISGCLAARVGGKNVNLGTLASTRDTVC